jgi:hypothetical protein
MSVHRFQPRDKESERIEQPPSLGERAIDNLRFIRETMERSTSFTAVPGYGGALMGLTAVVASIIAHNQTLTKDWLKTWLIEAGLAFVIGFFAVWQKSKINGTSLLSAPARKFAFGFTPPLICGIVLTIGFWRYGHFELMIPTWLLLYGAAVATGGSYSVRIVPIMGWCFIFLGTLAFFLPASWGNPLMGLGFGVLQIIFGIIIARNHGG